MDTRMYVMTQKKLEEIPDKMYLPLQVGKAGRPSLGYPGDDTGEQISEKNPFYCELTGIYWVWKNVKCDLVGICHYRRYFTRNGKLLDREYIEKTIQKYPIIIPGSSCVNEPDAFRHYAKRHNGRDLELCREIIRKKCPDYLAAFEFAMNTVLVSTCNMWITRKDIFDRYCSWLFDLLFEAEKEIAFWEYDDYQKRVMGFLAERLFRVWLFMQPEAIMEETITLADSSEFSHAKKRADLLYQCVRLKIRPLLELYQAGAMENGLVQPFCCKDDFEQKVPVWVCWWQGEDEMPELIRGCIGSVRKCLPKDKTVLRLITLENCMEYVTFTEEVIRKFNEGKISYGHLSELLRAELLFRYGGMWVDASVFFIKPIERNLPERRLFTLRSEPPEREDDIAKGRWFKGLWFAQKGHKLFRFLTESLWYYWEVGDEPAEGSLIDDLIAAAYDEFPEIRQELEQSGACGNAVFLMHRWMNRIYTPERAAALEDYGTFYQLDHRAAYRKENMAGERTLYGYLFTEGENEV